MNNKQISLCLVISLLVGCQWQKGDGTYDIFVDSGFTDHQEDLVRQGVQKWEDSMGSVVVFHWTTNWRQAQDMITISPSSIPDLTSKYGRGEWGSKYDVGHTSWFGTSSLVEIATDQNDYDFLHVVEHEMGHALGLGHTQAGTVMYHEVTGSAEEVTCEDVKQFCEIWGCDVQGLPACQADSCH